MCLFAKRMVVVTSWLYLFYLGYDEMTELRISLHINHVKVIFLLYKTINNVNIYLYYAIHQNYYNYNIDSGYSTIEYHFFNNDGSKNPANKITSLKNNFIHEMVD